MTATPLNMASLPNPETLTRRVFPNEVVGLAWENYSSPSVVIHGWLRAGNVDVPPEKAGLSSMTASLLTHGTERRSFSQIGEEIESVGATLSVGSSGHTTGFTAKCLVEDLPLILDVMTDCLYHPTFPAEYVEKRRGEILTAIRQRENNTQSMASLRLHETMYVHHPYGQSQLGYRETVENLTREDVQQFYRDHYGTSGMGVVIVGAISQGKGLDLLEDAMGGWNGQKRGQSPLPPTSRIEGVHKTSTTIPGKTQTDIALGWIGPKRRDPAFLSVYLANCILGQFGMMGRIGDHVRDELGLAYYAYTSLETGLGPGPWAAIAGVAPENVDRAIEAILGQVEKLREEPVGTSELEDNKAYLVGSMPLRLETKEHVAAQLAHIEVYELGLDYLQRYPELIQAITAEEVMAAGSEYLKPDAYVVSVAGPPEAKVE